MHEHDDDQALLRKQRHFLDQIERELRTVNRDLIHAKIPELNRDSFLRLATRVAGLRCEYLQTAIEFSRADPGSADAARLLPVLRERRLAFEESRDAFAALERAIQQGYVDIGG